MHIMQINSYDIFLDIDFKKFEYEGRVKIDLISKFRYGGHIFSTSRRKDLKSLDNINAIHWLKSRIGTKAYDTLWMRLFDMKFFQYKDNLSAAWIGARIRRMALSRKHTFSESLRLGYLEGGSNTLFSKILEKIVNMGGRLRTHSEVEKIVIIDRAVSFGNEGQIAIEIKALLFDEGMKKEVHALIKGLGGLDIDHREIVEEIKKVM